jgi:hypothetical protein
LGDACDCKDKLCTQGNNIDGKPICDPIDPACPVCGNGIVETGEQCDGTDLNRMTCLDL